MPRPKQKGWSHELDLRQCCPDILTLLSSNQNGASGEDLPDSWSKLLTVEVWREVGRLPEPFLSASLPFILNYVRGETFWSGDKGKCNNENVKNLMYHLLCQVAKLTPPSPGGKLENLIISEHSYNQINRMKLVMALKFESISLRPNHDFAPGVTSTQMSQNANSAPNRRWGFAPQVIDRLTNSKTTFIEACQTRFWKHDLRTVTDLEEITQAFNILSKLLKAEAPGVSSGSSQTLSDLNSSMWNTTSDGGLDESEIGTGFTRDPLIDRGIPRQFLKWTPFDWAIPLFAGFYLQEVMAKGNQGPDPTSTLSWLLKLLLKRLQSGPPEDFSPWLLDLCLTIVRMEAAKVSKDLQIEFDRLALKAAAGDSVVYRASLCDIDRVCKKHQEQKDDASETSFLSLSENDNNGNFIESSSQGTSTAPAGQGPVQQLLTMVLRHLDEDKSSGVGWTLLKNSLTPLLESSSRDNTDWANLLFSLPRVWSWNRFFQLGSQPAIKSSNDYSPPRVLQRKTSREMNKDRMTFAEGLWAKLYPGHVDVHKPTDIPYLEELRTSFLKIAKGLCRDESDDSSSDDSRRSRHSSSSSTVYVTDSDFEASRRRESNSSESDQKSKFRVHKRKSPSADSVTSSDSSDEDAPPRPGQNKKVSEKIGKSFESSRSLVMHNHSLPNVNPVILSMVNTSKDLGMVAEMPKEIAFHVVLKAVCDRQMLNAVKGRGRGKRPVDKKCPMNSYAALPGDNMSVEHLIVAHEATEAIHNRSSNDGGFGKYPCVKEKRIKEVASEILRLWMYSVGNLFYARDDKTLAEGLDMFFVEEKKRAGFQPYRDALVKILLGLEPPPGTTKMNSRAARKTGLNLSWILDQLKVLKASWNLNPFRKKVSELLGEDMEELAYSYGIPVEAMQRCIDIFKQCSEQRLVLSGITKITLQKIERDEEFGAFAEKLGKVIKRKFQVLLLPPKVT